MQSTAKIMNLAPFPGWTAQACVQATAAGAWCVRPVPEGAIWAVMPQRRLVPPRVRAFVDFLVGKFGDPPPWERSIARARQPAGRRRRRAGAATR